MISDRKAEKEIMTNSEKKSDSKDTLLERLNSGLLLLNLKKEIDEAAYSVIEQVTFGRAVVRSRHTYSSELIRVLDELKLTRELLNAIDEHKKLGINAREPEELMNYYSGIFFGLVHQIKDKLLRLIDFMAAEETQKRPYPEPEKVSPARLLRKHGVIVDKIGIRELVMAWSQDDSPIGVILKKRTQHHHRASKLQLNNDFLNVKMSKLMLTPQPTERLSDYGKEYLTNLGAESYAKLKEETLKKQQNSINIIEKNLNSIAEKLICYYKVPISSEEKAKIASDYADFLSSLKIKNEASLQKITPEAKQMTDELIKTTEKLGVQVVSAYIVGSAVRGEYIPGSSDINMYVITKDFTQIYDTEQPAMLYILSEEDFLSDKHKKDRFICWSDGVRVLGKEYKFKEKEFPKPGTLLCLLLNRGVIERLESYRDKIIVLEKPDNIQLRLLELKVTKIMLDYAFGVAMSNKPFYSASRKKKIEHIKSAFPNMPLTIALEQLYYGRMITQDNFVKLIDSYLKNAKKNYAKQLEVEKQVSK